MHPTPTAPGHHPNWRLHCYQSNVARPSATTTTTAAHHVPGTSATAVTHPVPAPLPQPIEVPAPRVIARKAIAGLALAAVFGAAVGARYGIASIVVHAAGAPLALAAVTTVVVPSLYVALAYAGWSLRVRTLVWLCARALWASGVWLVGVAPAAIMLSVSVESDVSAAIITALGLTAAIAVMLRAIVGGLETSSYHSEYGVTASPGALTLRGTLFVSFYLVGGATALRIWWLAMPLLGGSQ